MILYNSENNIRDIRPFCRPLFCHSSVVNRGERILIFQLLIHIRKILHIHIQSLSKNFINLVTAMHLYPITALAPYKYTLPFL